MNEANSKVIDWTIYALNKFVVNCLKRGDYDEAMLVETSMELYDQGMLDVSWSDGQPMFSLSSDAKLMMDVMKGTPEGSAIETIENKLKERNNEPK